MTKTKVFVAAVVFLAGFAALPPLMAGAGQEQSKAAPSAANPDLKFEVASIKPSAAEKGKPGQQMGVMAPMPGGQTYQVTSEPLRNMILLMYHLSDDQLIGTPKWADDDLWDIEAKADAPHAMPELHTMFQNLLADRFKLQFHYETQTLPVYALSVDKAGAKMKASASTDETSIPIKRSGYGRLTATRCSMNYFSWYLSQIPQLSKPVVDETGLSGFYDFDLTYTPELSASASPGEQTKQQMLAKGPELPEALREELGLRLESRKGPVQVMVIDHVEKPSGN